MALRIEGYRIEREIDALPGAVLLRAREDATGRPALVKVLSAASPDARDVRRLEREHRILGEMAEAPGILPAGLLLGHGDGGRAIVSPVSGRPLSELMAAGETARWPMERALEAVVGLAEAVDAVHARGVVHKNVAPRNVLVTDAGAVLLMNFGIATFLAREHQDRRLSRRLEGSLPYVSPEQTGRMAQDLDHRSDFYSLGVVMFELLFGCLPFEADTPLEWVHAHVGQAPRLPAEARVRVPAPLIEIVLKLLSKGPEERYQSGFGLLSDLRRCRDAVARTGGVAPFALGRRDISQSFAIPKALFGRAREVEALTRLFGEVERGASEICLVSGPAGVGKTALADALAAPVARTRGIVLRGKFDQYARAEPYAGVSEAFGGLVEELLAETPERLEAWRAGLLEALGGNARLLVDLVPGLERILGPRPAPPALPPTEARNRLLIVLTDFVRHLTAGGRPIVLYLDDLQWSDAPTLALLRKLATTRDLGHLLILGTYRSNAVGASHLLTLARDEIAAERTVHEMALDPLSRGAITEMAAAALRTDAGRARRVGAVLHALSGGNPFFAEELMGAFARDGLIRFDRAEGRWAWDIAAIERADPEGGIVDFLIADLSRLPQAARDTLRLAACIGHEFDLGTLATVHDLPRREIGASLTEALERNVLLPLDDGYLLYDASAPADAPSDAGPVANPRFRFRHDRLHQAAYELTEEADRARVHLSIGRLLRAGAGEAPGGEAAVGIVRHLNEARALIADPEERLDLARLNLAAAQLAHDASSYVEGLHHLDMARDLLPDDAWERHYGTAKALSSLYAQTAYLNGRLGAADAELTDALGRVRTPLERVAILSMRTRHYSTLGRMHDAIDTALEGLAILGIAVGRDVPEAVLEEEHAAIARHLAGREVAELAQAPRMEDEGAAAAVTLLMEIFPPAFLSGAGNLFHFLVLRAVRLSLRHGNSTETAFAYAAYGMLLCGALDRPAEGYRFGRLALEMNESYDDIGLKSRIIYVHTMFAHHWSQHWSSMTALFKQGIEAGYRSGDLLYLAYNAQDCVIWDPTLDLPTALAEQERYLEIVRDCNYADSRDSATLFLQMLRNFAGATEGRFSLSDAGFDEEACVAGMAERGFKTGIANRNIYRIELHCLYGDHAGALPFVEAQEALIDSVMSLPQAVRFRFLAHRVYAALSRGGGDHRAAMGRHRAQMALWSANCPENFRHLELAMEAEEAALEGRALDAMRGFAAAGAQAARTGFARDRATIEERCAEAAREAGLETAAAAHLAEALRLYERWGARRKVEQLGEAQPGLAPAPDGGAGAAPDGAPLTQDALDLGSVMDAARAISGEIHLPELQRRIMETLLRSAGARRGVFLSVDPGEAGGLSIETECALSEGGAVTCLPAPAGRALADAVPLSVANYALRTGAPVVIEDAGASRFARDPFVARRGTRSVLCMPIVRAEAPIGLVYLENDLAPRAFARGRIAVVEMLAAQAAISIETARLYVGLERQVEERTAALSAKSATLEALAGQLSKYLPPQIYRSIFDRQKEVRIAAERKVLTVFFSDIVGFTRTADAIPSEDLTRLLNRYLSEMAEIALAHGATIDKFVGDAIVIFFGDPGTRGERGDALACARMALAMRRRLDALRAEWREEGVETPLECRMGIHTGECTVGNFGSETRMDYTIIGGTVNLAARLEAAARPGTILVSAETAGRIAPEIATRPRGAVEARGIERPVEVHEITGEGP